MDPIYIGVDFHARQQTICYLKTETGELVICELKHQDKQALRAFYVQFSGHVIVGLEASGYSPWFEATTRATRLRSLVGRRHRNSSSSALARRRAIAATLNSFGT